MIKINYPKDSCEFNESYKSCFKKNVLLDKSKRLKKLFLSNDKFNHLRQYSFEDILIFPIEKLYTIAVAYQGIALTNDEELTIEGIFNYDTKKPKNLGTIKFDGGKRDIISDFFMNRSKELNISTCYFCNINFINSYSSFNDYETIVDFLNYGTKEELEELENVAEGRSLNIILERSRNKFLVIEDLLNISSFGDKVVSQCINSFNKRNKHNCYTLDHVIDKGVNPILALSLYNLVPSCYSCNSKLKGSKQFIRCDEEVSVSPSSVNNNFNNEVEFQLLFAKGDERDYSSFNYDDKLSDFGKIVLDIKSCNKKYEEFLKIFRLRGRYFFHKREALKLLKLKKKYSNSQIEKFAELLYGKSKDNILPIFIDSIKRDIFGREIFEGDIQDKSFTKLKRDIAKQIGIDGVKED